MQHTYFIIQNVSPMIESFINEVSFVTNFSYNCFTKSINSTYSSIKNIFLEPSSYCIAMSEFTENVRSILPLHLSLRESKKHNNYYDSLDNYYKCQYGIVRFLWNTLIDIILLLIVYYGYQYYHSSQKNDLQNIIEQEKLERFKKMSELQEAIDELVKLKIIKSGEMFINW